MKGKLNSLEMGDLMSKKNILIIICSILAAILLAYIIIKVAGSTLKVHTDKENYFLYLNELQKKDDVHSGLFIFPNNINQNDIVDFKYFFQDGIFDGSYLFYVVVKYDKYSLNNEEDRLRNIKVNFEKTEKKILYEENDFDYPAYVSISDGFSTFEYALIDKKNNQIIYIFDQLFFFDELGINDEYSPNGYIVSIDKRDYKSLGYNMYYLYDKYGGSKKYNEK